MMGGRDVAGAQTQRSNSGERPRRSRRSALTLNRIGTSDAGFAWHSRSALNQSSRSCPSWQERSQ